MKSGLEEFLKRIEAKPTNETLIDRFMSLVLEEPAPDRILYLKSLVGLLLKSNPYAALKAAAVELQEARKEQLNHEYEIGALKDVESCFLNLGKSENAAIIRDEIAKLQSEYAKAKGVGVNSAPAPKPSTMPSVPAPQIPQATAPEAPKISLAQGAGAAAAAAPAGSAAQAFFASLANKVKGSKPAPNAAPVPAQEAAAVNASFSLTGIGEDKADDFLGSKDEPTNPTGVSAPLIAEPPADAPAINALANEAAIQEAALEEARAEAEEQARIEEEARLEAEQRARIEEEARLEAEEQARIEEEARLEAEERARIEEEARLEAEEQARLEEEARLEAEQRARIEEEARLEAEERARIEEEARLEAEERARIEEEARIEAEERARIEEEARLLAEEEARLEAEALARIEEEARLESERRAREEEERLAAEARAREEAEAKARAEAEARAREEAEAKARAEAEAKAKAAEAKAKAKAEAEVRMKAEAKLKAEADIKARKEAEAKAKAAAKTAEFPPNLNATATKASGGGNVMPIAAIPNAADEIGKSFHGNSQTLTKTNRAPLPPEFGTTPSTAADAAQGFAASIGNSKLGTAQNRLGHDDTQFNEPMATRVVKSGMVVGNIHDKETNAQGFAPLATSIAQGLPIAPKKVEAPAFSHESTRARPSALLLEDDEVHTQQASAQETAAIAFEARNAAPPLPQNDRDDDEDDDEGDYEFALEYTKKNRVPVIEEIDDNFGVSHAAGAPAHIPAPVAQVQTQAQAKPKSSSPFSLRDEEDEVPRLSANAGIDETYEPQPFFQPDDDDEEEEAQDQEVTPPPSDRTMMMSLENLNESQEQMDLAANSSAKVQNIRIPINSGPNFVILDDDENEDTKIEAPIYADDEASEVESTLPDAPAALDIPDYQLADEQDSEELPDFATGIDLSLSLEIPAKVQAPSSAPIYAPEPPMSFDSPIDPMGEEEEQAPAPEIAFEAANVIPVSFTPKPKLSHEKHWQVLRERLKLMAGYQDNKAPVAEFIKRLLQAKTETPKVQKITLIVTAFLAADTDNALAVRDFASWLFEDLDPGAMHELFLSLNLQEEQIDLYLEHLECLRAKHQHRLALSVMHDVLRLELDLPWYERSYPVLQSLWEKLGLEGWKWLPEEGTTVFCDRLARREEPMIATLLA